MTTNAGNTGFAGFSPNPLRLAIFTAVPAWRRYRSLHQVPDLPGDYILTLNRVIQAVRSSSHVLTLGQYGIYPSRPANKKTNEPLICIK